MIKNEKKQPRKDANSVQISDLAAEVLDRLAESTELPKKMILERLIVWLSNQSDVIQGTVLNTIPKSISADVAVLTLLKMAESGSVGISLPEGENIEKIRADLELRVALVRGAELLRQAREPQMPRRQANDAG